MTCFNSLIAIFLAAATIFTTSTTTTTTAKLSITKPSPIPLTGTIFFLISPNTEIDRKLIKDVLLRNRPPCCAIANLLQTDASCYFLYWASRFSSPFFYLLSSPKRLFESVVLVYSRTGLVLHYH